MADRPADHVAEIVPPSVANGSEPAIESRNEICQQFPASRPYVTHVERVRVQPASLEHLAECVLCP